MIFKMKYFLLILIIFATSMLGFSQNEKKFIREGNKQYNQKNYNEAEVNYRKSLQNDSNYFKGKYNLANTMYKQKNYDEAARLYSSIAEQEKDNKIKAKVYHNLGNSLLQKKEYDKSIEAYKQALKNNPTDIDTKYNLSYALQMLRQQQNQKNKDNKDKKDKKDDKDKQKQDQNQDKKENKQQQQQQQQKDVKKEEAERMLDALKNNEKKTMDKVKKQKVVNARVKIEKDW
ncbi:MAG: tetratricopeptide repeat protein [Bacteroidetes bacterium]|nr:tetratricopeptide repeat protein [Bacteroidota bacterium]